jgi:hypothetical protein
MCTTHPAPGALENSVVEATMIKKAVVACAAGVMASLVFAPSAGASDSTAGEREFRPAVVQLATRATPINSDGSVDVVMWVRCRGGLNVFEMSTSVTQTDTSGFTFAIGPGLLPCDGTRHRTVVNVVPDEGQAPFHKGFATLDVYLGIYDGTTDTDSEARDTAKVRLYQR